MRLVIVHALLHAKARSDGLTGWCPPSQEQSKELANGADSAGEEPETENSPGSKKALDAAKQRDWEETAIEGGDDGEEVEDAGRR